MVKCSARSAQQIRHRLTALQAPRDRIRANADNRKASRPSLFERPQKTATVLLNNIYRTPVSGVFRGLWREPGDPNQTVGGGERPPAPAVIAWEIGLGRTTPQIAPTSRGDRGV